MRIEFLKHGYNGFFGKFIDVGSIYVIGFDQPEQSAEFQGILLRFLGKGCKKGGQKQEDPDGQ